MQMSGKLPEDIQKTVGEVLGRPGERMGVDQYMGLSLRVGLALAAERERCARIAETTGIAAGRAIAAAIRKPTPYPAWQKLSD